MLGSLVSRKGKLYSLFFRTLYVGRAFTGAWSEVPSAGFWKPLVLSRFHGSHPALYQFCHVMFVNVMTINLK